MNTNKNNNSSAVRNIGFYIVLAVLFILMVFGLREGMETRNTVTQKQFEQMLEQGEVISVEISQNQQVPTGVLEITVTDGTIYTLNVSDVRQEEQLLRGYEEVAVKVNDVEKDRVFLTTILPVILMCVMLIFFAMMMNRQAGSSNAKMMNFGKSHARMITPDAQRVTFSDVAGLQEEKEDLQELVDFLRKPEKYLKVGARIPKGVILVGPPGTGKTLLARAVAGEAGVPFFSISGSDFVEMFVGVGASRVRDLFGEAKKNKPCIIFIDEIDAVARRRGTGMGGGHDEREQTLNQLLVEMDGFTANEGIIVMAATNRVDILDPAILRPGRFDRQVAVGRPDIKGREEILKVHSKDKPLGDDVNLGRTARTTFIKQADIDKAFIKVGIGDEKKSHVISEKEKRITAYHESGHAILFHLLPDVGPVHTISIIPTGRGAAGYTMPLPERDEMFNTRSEMLENIVVDLGGRIAEELVIGDVTTGASQDIKQATAMARAMVTKYGMSERLGLVNYEQGEDEIFIGRDIAHSKAYGENVQSEIDDEVKRIIDEAYDTGRRLIESHMDVLHASAKLLMEKEKIGREEFEAHGRMPPVPHSLRTSKPKREFQRMLRKPITNKQGRKHFFRGNDWVFFNINKNMHKIHQYNL